jgi:uncharacterized protein VirK/YbjX
LQPAPRSRSWPQAGLAPAAWPSRVAVLGTLFHAASYERPGTAPIGLRHVLTHWCRCAVHLDTFRGWIGDAGNPALQEVVALRPSIVTCVVHPYLHSDWSARRKLETIAGHYALLQGHLAFLRTVSTRAIGLVDAGDGLQIRIEAPGKFEHEGQLVISLVRDPLRLFSLAFTFAVVDGQRVAYVGALQGLSSPDALEIYRSLTHRMHGLRPRDLLVTVFRMLCLALGFRRILAVGDDARVSSNRYFASSSQVLSSYDVAWLESGGVATGHGFFELGAALTPRSAEDIPARKRALYRRRHAMIADLSAQISQSVTPSV